MITGVSSPSVVDQRASANKVLVAREPTASPARFESDRAKGWIRNWPAANRAKLKPGLYTCDGPKSSTTHRYIDEASVGSYTIVESADILNSTNDALNWCIGSPDRVFIISDGCAWQLYGLAISNYLKTHDREFEVFVLPCIKNNELNKTDVMHKAITRWLLSNRATRDDTLINFGGGVTTDLGGYVACTYRRGLRRINLPTTLIAMVDAALSPKTAINACGSKNLLGTTNAPDAVVIDHQFLRSLPHRYLLSGAAEIVKLAVIRSTKLFQYLEIHGKDLLNGSLSEHLVCGVVSSAARTFLRMKWEPPFPGNRPASLRAFGHSFSKQIESFAGFMLPHGFAVSVEMSIATQLAYQLGVLGAHDRDRIQQLIMSLGLPCYHDKCHIDIIWPVFNRRLDRGKPLYFPVPTGVGAGAFLNHFTRSQLADAVKHCRSFSTSTLGEKI